MTEGSAPPLSIPGNNLTIPYKELGTEVFFQFLDSPRQRRLLNMQPFRRAGETEFPGNTEEATKVLKFHRKRCQT